MRAEESPALPVRPRIAAAMLAGGEGRRMGGADKQRIELDGTPLGLRIVSLLSGHFSELIVVTGNAGLYAHTEVHTVTDIIPGFGPLSGLHAALSSTGADWIYLAACDMPHFSPSWAAYLASLALRTPPEGPESCAAIVTAFGPHIEPFHALYSRACLGVLEMLLTTRSEERSEAAGNTFARRPSFRDFLAHVPHRVVPEREARRFSPDWRLFLNINRPEDLAAYSAESGGWRDVEGPGGPGGGIRANSVKVER
ncbi:MAG: molybdenum cofactor guanylyltransferase [Rectinemataceae bacterium]